MSERILLVDPDPALLSQAASIIARQTGYQTHVTTDPLQAAGLVSNRDFDLVLTALAMPQQSGLDLLRSLKGLDGDLPVVLMTAYPSVEAAVQAMKLGAFDFLAKPVHEEQLLLTIERAMQWRRRLKGAGEGQGPVDELALIPGASRAMREIQRKIHLVADTGATVLITGESGTGKELVARSLHLHSGRRDKPLVIVSCAATPADLLEQQLFGHVKGAFPGAARDKPGLLAEAQGGALFLDEIGDLSPGLQAKLLRLLQEGEHRPLGGNQVRKADVRFIAATSQNLDLKVAEGSFRQDLYFRLNVIRLDLPPLRKRPEDIPILARYFLEKHARLHGIKNMEMGQRTLEILQSRSWPGNVRELENVIKRAVLLSQGLRLEGRDIFPEEADGQAFPDQDDAWALPFKEAKAKVLDAFLHRYVQKLLARHQGNVSKAAEASGIKRQYLHKIMKQAGIKAAVYKKQI